VDDSQETLPHAGLAKRDVHMALMNVRDKSTLGNGLSPLIGPEEWDALLDTFEEAEALAPREGSSDELWDRLSSTRWVKTTYGEGTQSAA
jgi:hypothetical protein